MLRVIQERKFKRVGGVKEIPLNTRIIVASKENLRKAYRTGKFREDLYHRFNEFSIHLPPLRKRKEDIPLFADFFVKKSCNELNKQVNGFEEDVMNMFMNYDWPGNLMECRNVIRRVVLLCKGNTITRDVLPAQIIIPSGSPRITADSSIQQQINILPAVKKETHLKDTAARAEYEAIMKVLKEVNFNKSEAAIMLNVDRKTLYNKIKNYESLAI